MTDLTPADAPVRDRATPGDRMLTVLALIAIGTLPLLPTFATGRFPRTQEGVRYETLATLFHQMLGEGFWYPRWLPELAGGLGYPTFVFYQPGVFIVSSIWMAMGAGSVLAIQLTDLTFAIAGSGGAYLLARQFLGRWPAVACAALFMITPYAYVNLYVRGDHSEFAAMMLTPWPLACLMIAVRRLAERGRPLAASLVVAAIALAAIIITHPAVAMVFVPLVMVMAALRGARLSPLLRLRWLMLLALVGVTAAAFSSPYWWHVWRDARYVRLDRVATSVSDPLEHVIEPWRLVSIYWGFGGDGVRSLGQPVEMSFQLGLPHLVLAIAGAWLGRRRPWIVMAAISYLAIALLMTTLAAPVWRVRTPLRIMQFPWRLLSVCASLQLLLACSAFASLRLRPRSVALIALACVLVAAGWYHAMFRPSPKPFAMTDGSTRHFSLDEAQRVVNGGVIALPRIVEYFATMQEFDPVWIRAEPSFRLGEPIVHGRGIALQRGSNDRVIRAIVRSDSPRQIRLEQFYFPGWHVEVNGQRIADADLRSATLPDGRMQVPVPAGEARLLAYYDGPPGWRTQLVIAVCLAATGLAAIVLLARSPLNASEPPPQKAPAP